MCGCIVTAARLDGSTGKLNNGGPCFEMTVAGHPVLLEPHDVLPLLNALFEFMIEAAKPKSN